MDGSDILTVLSLRDYNTRLVVLCTLLLGCACGMIGSFLLLRKRSLMGDTLSHATLPGVGIAFIISVLIGGDEKSLPLLLAGATITGLLGCFCVQFIRYNSRVKDDAAMGIVLSVFFWSGSSVTRHHPDDARRQCCRSGIFYIWKDGLDGTAGFPSPSTSDQFCDHYVDRII